MAVEEEQNNSGQSAHAPTLGAYPPPQTTALRPSPTRGRSRSARMLVVVGITVGAMLLAACIAGFIYLLTTNGHENQGGGSVRNDAAGLHYRNTRLGIALDAAPGWKEEAPEDEVLHLRRDTCVLSVLDNTLFTGSDAFARGLRSGMQKQNPRVTFGGAAAWHGKAPAPPGFTVTLPVHAEPEPVAPVHGNWFLLRHGTHLTSLFEVAPADDAACGPLFAQIEQSVVVD